MNYAYMNYAYVIYAVSTKPITYEYCKAVVLKLRARLIKQH